MPTNKLSVDLEESLARRFRARVAYVGTTVTTVLTERVVKWLGPWGSNTCSHTLGEGETLRSIAELHYGDPELYWVLAHFNDIRYPEQVQPGQLVLVPEPGTSPTGLVPGTAIPEGTTKTTVSADMEDELQRRFRARTAFESSSAHAWLYHLVAVWTGHWPTKSASYTVKPGDTLSAIAFRFYNDARKYWVIAHFNGIANPALIRVGQRLAIPSPSASGQLPAGESPHIFGIHDAGGEHLMADMDKKGWVLSTEDIGRNPHDHSGRDYTGLQTAGYGVMVRLNHGYCRPASDSYPGTIPEDSGDGVSYQEFAVRCGNFVEASPGCHIWIIGNEMNHTDEWPGGPSGQMITPQLYSDCYKRCYTQIHRRPGHGGDQVIVGAPAPWNASAQYPGNERGDWVKFLQDILRLLGGKCDGVALHTYTHGHEVAKITTSDGMQPPFEDRYYEFRAYRQFMEVIPASMRGLPVYITETDQNDPWAPHNTGWVQAAYAEINRWNGDLNHQRIRCLLLYRWLAHDQWSFADIREVQDDFRAALTKDYRWWR